MIAFIVTVSANDGMKSTIGGILIGFLLGVALTYLIGWGIFALLGRKFMFKMGLHIAAFLVGLVGAVRGDSVAAEKRPLVFYEQYRAELVFGNTLNYKKVKIVSNAQLINFWTTRAPYNTIYLSKKMAAISAFEGRLNWNYEDILIHELTHVWQTQHRIGIVKKVTTALKVVVNRTKPYRYGKGEGLTAAINKKQNFRRFNTEQQGSIIAHYFCSKFHKRSTYHAQLEHFARQVRYNKGYHIEIDTFPEMPQLRSYNVDTIGVK